jgi:hypothetical protein
MVYICPESPALHVRTLTRRRAEGCDMFSGFSPCPLFVEKLKFYGMSGAATGWNVMKASALGSRCASGRVQGSIVGSTVLRVYNYESTESRRPDQRCGAEKKGEKRTAQVLMTKRWWLMCAFLVAQTLGASTKPPQTLRFSVTSGAH